MATSQYGGLSVRPALISRPDVTGGDDAQDKPADGLGLSAPGSCHACASWTDSPMTLDMDNGIVVFPDTFGGGLGEVFELASGFKGCCAAAGGNGLPGPAGKDTDDKIKQFVAATYEVRPVEWKPGWNVRDGLAFSHIYDPLAARNENLADQAWYKGAIPLRQQLTLHRALEAQAQSTRIAGLAEGVVLRGDWRQSTRRARTTDGGVRARGAAHGAQPLRGGRGPAAGARGDRLLQFARKRGREGALRHREQEARGGDREAEQGAGAAPARRRSRAQAASRAAQAGRAAGVSL